MRPTLTPMDVRGADREEVVAFLSRNHFPFHVVPSSTPEKVRARIEEGAYGGADTAPFWVDDPRLGRLGIVVLLDLDDDSPMFDIRLDGAHRARGLGVPVLKVVTTHVFTTMPGARRFEGQTREDNIAMRRVFTHCGFVKEAHCRQGWPVEGGEPLASVAYAILRSDWESGVSTPVPFDDLGY
ncbi:GNAT family protein [Actinomyces sp.]|uniref:GNAT family N-acetyltransferase n=1 Tax=Actinomyces sp. TaxID=29317 RepID=UPI00289A013B|nr:GNAT family protein [Actinomyces sp.]